ncbi:hypothetical protein [Ferrovibrio sp.]|uniref:hypothetical protein n=1 Tax=Ferrovibrio sp. TaxID=1917215 RepID=UPI003D10161C
MSAEAAETQPAPASAFVPMAEGLGPQELYYCQVEVMLGTLLGRLLVVGLYCLVIAGWKGALLGMGLLLLLGWRQILRHKDRPDLLRYNYRRNIWAGVLLVFAPLLIRLGYAALQAWAPGVLDAWLGFTAPMVEYFSRHLSTFDEMRQVHAIRFAGAEPVAVPRLDLALHMQMLHWLSVPALFLFAPLLAIHLRQVSPLTGREIFKVVISIVLTMIFFVLILNGISESFGQTTSFKLKSLKFSIIQSLLLQVPFFLSVVFVAGYAIHLTNIILSKGAGRRNLEAFSQRFLPYRSA